MRSSLVFSVTTESAVLSHPVLECFYMVKVDMRVVRISVFLPSALQDQKRTQEELRHTLRGLFTINYDPEPYLRSNHEIENWSPEGQMSGMAIAIIARLWNDWELHYNVDYDGTVEPGYWFENSSFFFSKDDTTNFMWANKEWTLFSNGGVDQTLVIMSMNPESDKFETDRQYTYNKQQYWYVDA